MIIARRPRDRNRHGNRLRIRNRQKDRFRHRNSAHKGKVRVSRRRVSQRPSASGLR